MGKAFGIVLIVVGLWVGLEIYTEGTQRAFGGLFTRLGLEQPAAEPESARAPLDALRESVSQDRDLAMERRRRAMGDPPE